VDRQLGNLHRRIVDLACNTRDIVFMVPDFLNGTLESSPPRKHGHYLFTSHQAADVGNDVNRIIRRDISTPT